MRRFSRIIAISLATLWFVSICAAQQTFTTAVPNLIRYGGTLKDTTGAPIAATTGITFAIYKQQDGGAAVWMETQNVTPDASGQYSVLLGSTTATGLPSDLFSQEEQRWLAVQVQGQVEQPRVLLVSVPYAFKAHEAETLGGKTISDFVLAKDVNVASSGAAAATTSGTGSTQTASGKSNAKSPSNLATAQGPTNFTGTTSDQIVSAVQSGTGKAIVASSSTGNAIVATTSSTTTTTYAVSGTVPGAGVAILGHATSASAQGYGIQGTSDSNIGIGLLGFATAATGSTYGLKGYSSSTGGTGVRGLSTAPTGSTTGISASVASAAGTAGIFNNTAGGKILSGQNNGAEKFSVDGSGNVNARGTLTGSGAGLTGIQFSQLVGSLASSQFSGSYSNPVTLSNTSNVYYGDGSNLTGVVAASGSAYYIQNGTSQQTSANFNISGNGSAGGTLLGNVVNSATSYQIAGGDVLNDYGGGHDSLFLGLGAGGCCSSGDSNFFGGNNAGHSNTTGFNNTFTGEDAGRKNDDGKNNTFYGYAAGYNNNYGQDNTFSGVRVGWNNYGGTFNAFFGYEAGYGNINGIGNTYIGAGAASSNVGDANSFFGVNAGYNNTTSNNNIYVANRGCPHPCSESSTIRIGGDLGLGYGIQTATYIAGIYGSTSSGGVPVYINSDGLLGTLTSSLRFKEQVRDMGESSGKLFQLRPVTFFYKPQYDDGSRTLQYGLIAEEVAKVYPELVAYDKDGQPYTVKYQYLAPMLLNELQKQHAVVAVQQDVIKTQQQQLQTQGQQIADLQQRLSRLEAFIGAKK